MATVLVVDDDLETRDLMVRHLTLGGHCALAAANGWEALIAMDRQAVDLILLDMMMPGMDGGTFMRIFRQSHERRNSSVVVVSALDEVQVRETMSRYDIAHILPKKGDFYSELLPVVERHAGGTGTDSHRLTTN